MNDQSRYIVDSRYFDGTCLTFMTDGFRSDFGGETLEEMPTAHKQIISTILSSSVLFLLYISGGAVSNIG